MKYIFLSLSLLILFSCKSPEEKQPVTSDTGTVTLRNGESPETVESDNGPCYGSFAHNVYIWLKQPDNEEDREAFLASLYKFLDASEYVVSSHVGAPALSDRDVVDDSFTFSIVLTFKNKEEQDLYQVEPVHVQFVEESSHLWNKVVVYDSENLR
ncbi:Dabb family protein [Aureisphaera galaxeae]|uniref:Dabb family protein n=1 Tax=Aureisphaera galaxeae TaxID=1538023 RepID=UPI00234FFEA5|nr:Dabb family protein [Aureisphaera galaxeae]MDC8004236.1 Dabb family protein [Aureisphaera galaxeae]